MTTLMKMNPLVPISQSNQSHVMANPFLIHSYPEEEIIKTAGILLNSSFIGEKEVDEGRSKPFHRFVTETLLKTTVQGTLLRTGNLAQNGGPSHSGAVFSESQSTATTALLVVNSTAGNSTTGNEPMSTKDFPHGYLEFFLTLYWPLVVATLMFFAISLLLFAFAMWMEKEADRRRGFTRTRNYRFGSITAYYNTYNKEECLICFDRMSFRQHIAVASCRHAFHVNCLNVWLKVKLECPMCKRAMGIRRQRSAPPAPETA